MYWEVGIKIDYERGRYNVHPQALQESQWDHAEFIQDMNDKREWGCTFSYTGKQYARDDVPHIAVDDTYIYFTMEPCDE